MVSWREGRRLECTATRFTVRAGDREGGEGSVVVAQAREKADGGADGR